MQVFMWLCNKIFATDDILACTEEIWLSISSQYSPRDIIADMPRTCPSMRFRRFVKSFDIFSFRLFAIKSAPFFLLYNTPDGYARDFSNYIPVIVRSRRRRSNPIDCHGTLRLAMTVGRIGLR